MLRKILTVDKGSRRWETSHSDIMYISFITLLYLFSFSKKKYLGGRVASRKRRSQHEKSKKGYINEVRQLGQQLSEVQQHISKLTTPIKPKKLEVYNQCPLLLSS